MIPIITIDGPAASGKGVISQYIANQLGFHYLESGLLYRATAFNCIKQSIDINNETQIAGIANNLTIRFAQNKIGFAEPVVYRELHTEEVSNIASVIASYPSVRAALLKRQRDFAKKPGLVADGRDMGSVVFPAATLKIFLTANVQVRALRRHKQLISQGLIEQEQSDIFDAILADLKWRDTQDQTRVFSPLTQQADAKLLDTTQISIADASAQILSWYQEVNSTNK